MNKIAVIMLVGLILLGISNYWTYILYENCVQEYNNLAKKYTGLVDASNKVEENYQEFREDIFHFAENNCTAVTIVCYTNFSVR